MTLLRAEEMTYTHVQEMPRERSIAFLSASALEVHGPHLPLGMDMFMAVWQKEETAKRFAASHPDWTVVVHPHLPVGTDELPLAGSMDGSQQTIYNALLSHGASLAKAGFGYAVVTNGHGGARHASALEAACRRVSRKHNIQMFSPSIAVLHGIITGARHEQLEESLGRSLNDDERRGLLAGEHAGTMETSFALAERPGQVSESYVDLKLDGPPAFTPLKVLSGALGNGESGHGEAIAHGVGWMLNSHFGYGRPYKVTYQGDPSAGSAELGHAVRETLAQGCLEYVEKVTSGEIGADDVRSIASDPAIIQPGFWQRAGLGVALVAAVGFVWAVRR